MNKKHTKKHFFVILTLFSFFSPKNTLEKVLQHFQKPHNQGVIKDADGVGQVGNPVCGDIMKIYIKVGKNKKGEEIRLSIPKTI